MCCCIYLLVLCVYSVCVFFVLFIFFCNCFVFSMLHQGRGQSRGGHVGARQAVEAHGYVQLPPETKTGQTRRINF